MYVFVQNKEAGILKYGLTQRGTFFFFFLAPPPPSDSVLGVLSYFADRLADSSGREEGVRILHRLLGASFFALCYYAIRAHYKSESGSCC